MAAQTETLEGRRLPSVFRPAIPGQQFLGENLWTVGIVDSGSPLSVLLSLVLSLIPL